MIDVPRQDLILMLEAGYIYLAMGKFAEARQVFEGVCLLLPQSDVPLIGLSNVHFAQKKHLPAIRTLKEAIAINPKSALAHAHLGEAYLFYGKKEDSLEALNIAVKLEPKGNAAQFARSLIDLIQKGYDPVALAKQQKAVSK